MEEYFSTLDLQKTNIVLKDILANVYWYNYPDHFSSYDENIEKFKDYKIIGKNKFIYFLEKDNFKDIYITYTGIHPDLWNHFTDLENLKNILNIYDNVKKSDSILVFIGMLDYNIDINLETFERFIYMHPLIHKIPWGSLYKPTVYDINNINSFDLALYITDILKQDENLNEINCRTIYSDSIISFSKFNGNLFIKYEFVNEVNKIPADLESILICLPKILSYRDLLELHPPMISEAILLADQLNDNDILKEIIDKLSEMINNKNEYDNDTQNVIYDALLKLTINRELSFIFEKEFYDFSNINEAVDKIYEKCDYDKKMFDQDHVKKHIKFVITNLV